MKKVYIEWDKWMNVWSVRYHKDGTNFLWKEYRESELDLALAEIKNHLLEM